MTASEIDPEEFKRLAADAEAALNEARPVASPPAPAPLAAPPRVIAGPRRWAEFVTPPRARAWIHASSYLLTLAGIALPLGVSYLLFPPAADRLYGTATFLVKLVYYV